MSTLGDLLGNKADDLVRCTITVGDVHIVSLSKSEGITPKDGKDSRDKFLIVLGFDKDGNVIGGIVINSKVNLQLPSYITDYLMPVSKQQLPFLRHDSFVNCSHLVTVHKDKFNRATFRGKIEDDELMELIVGTVTHNPYISRQQLKEFGIIKEQ
ncbi:MAG: hypothetical protein J5486_04300 [Bacteroidaceae bacterium]|nr:hypothetical protein [Bacteroidaceae bacterium]